MIPPCSQVRTMVGGKISHFFPNACCFHCWRPPSESLPNSSQFSPSVHTSVYSQDQCFLYLNVPVGHLGTLLTSRFRLRRSRWAEGWHHKEVLRCCSLLVGPQFAGAAGEWTLCRCLCHSSPFLLSLHKAGRGCQLFPVCPLIPLMPRCPRCGHRLALTQKAHQ